MRKLVDEIVALNLLEVITAGHSSWLLCFVMSRLTKGFHLLRGRRPHIAHS